ncbi:glutamate-5-semialdehyde dehydrogenase [Clostridium cellulovorans]|uniref:Gamma-glutamyl phosphate reductase n=1 Tax=Clostridium cellulovorans (strain ATCC 35296 / DSM 3052 / OCM 3 / 743B) TaxID=573061 RepID=D9SWS3_CLOC7|nr:glutamate-5-semialdehyde dehydrogenase [Clostridium cellulovorans]ADL51284.1 gamma-glutamyl phosphate reductase [Clostridium cellulovorans 743B]
MVLDYREYLIEKTKDAKEAARTMAVLSTDEKNSGLLNMAKALREKSSDIIEENKKDLTAGEAKGLSKAMLERLLLNEARIEDMAKGIENIVSLPDPIGEAVRGFNTKKGLNITQITVPLGVIGIIYESRPNVTADASALCIKSGNVCVLRGGSEAINSNRKIVEVLSNASEAAGLPKGVITLIDVTDREAVNALMKLNGYIDVLIPRGGAGLIKNVVENSTVPVIETGAGNCHVFVDESANFKMAEDIIINAKVQRPSVCNSIETILIHEKIAQEFLPLIKTSLENNKVEIRGCEKTQGIIGGKAAEELDWATEYNDLILAVKVVSNMEEAMDHIYKYGTKHSEAIVTENYANAQKFQRSVDAAAVYVNASTRFTDGGEFGFGAEIGISTQKLHARGPMALKELTSTKYLVNGNGQIR